MRFIGLATTIAIARLLTPEEIGTYAIASAVVMLLVEFRILGAGNYLVREPQIDEDCVRSALGLTVLICGTLGVVILAASVPVADFYGISDLAPIFAILSISFFVAPYISIPISLLSRDLAFGIQFYVRIAAAIVNAVVVISLILLGYSYFSLAIAQTISALTQFVILLWIRPDGMRYIPRFKGMKPIARVGIFSSLALLARKGQMALPDMIIGKMGTTGQVGMFSRGLGFIEFLSQTVFSSIHPVALPYLAKSRREGGGVREAYLKASVLTGALLIPVLGVASLSSLPAIRFMFGDQWDAAAPVASWLAIWAMLRSVHWFAGDMLLAVGREGLMLMRDSLTFVLLIPAIILLYPGGLALIAKGFVLVGVVEVLITTLVVNKVLRIGLLDFVRAWLSTAVVLACCMGVTLIVLAVVPVETNPAWLVIGVEALVLPPVWLGVLMLTRNPLYFEIRRGYRKIRGR
jgi:O-antigen/teichoic acid export membrane protein